MVKDRSDSKRGNPLLQHDNLLCSISSKGSHQLTNRIAQLWSTDSTAYSTEDTTTKLNLIAVLKIEEVVNHIMGSGFYFDHGKCIV